MASTGFAFPVRFRPSQVSVLMFLMLFLGLGACGPQKKYAGPYLPDAETAVIQPGDKTFTHVRILSVDRTPLYTNESSIAVHPGRHTVFFEATLDYPFLEKDLYFNQYLSFDVEAGRTYTLNATILPMENKGFAWVAADADPEKWIVKKYARRILPLESND